MDLLRQGSADPSPALDEDALEAIRQFYEEVGPALDAGTTKPLWGVTGHLIWWESLIVAAVPALCTALGAWLGSRNGRTVSMKIGDIEVKAHTREDVEELLARPQEIQSEIQQRNQAPKVIP